MRSRKKLVHYLIKFASLAFSSEFFEIALLTCINQMDYMLKV